MMLYYCSQSFLCVLVISVRFLVCLIFPQPFPNFYLYSDTRFSLLSCKLLSEWQTDLTIIIGTYSTIFAWNISMVYAVQLFGELLIVIKE